MQHGADVLRGSLTERINMASRSESATSGSQTSTPDTAATSQDSRQHSVKERFVCEKLDFILCEVEEVGEFVNAWSTESRVAEFIEEGMSERLERINALAWIIAQHS